MRKFTFGLIAICGVGLAFSGVAIAGSNSHAYVATNGNDKKQCTRDEPCRTFQVALAQVTPGGELVALDSGEFGPVTITQSVTLSGEGVHATITQEQSGADAITLKTTSSMTVILRGLTIFGLGKAGQGITLNDPQSSSDTAKPFSVAALYVEDCVIQGFTIKGIVFAPGTLGQLFVNDSFIRECGYYGIEVAGGLSTVHAQVSIERTRIEHNIQAGLITAAGFSQVTIGSSVLSGNGMGVSTGGLPSEVNIDNCLIANNGRGIHNFGITRVANSTITNNKFGVVNDTLPGGVIPKLLSRVNGAGIMTNTLAGNETDGSFTGTYAAK